MATMTASKVVLPPLIPSTHSTTSNSHPHSLSKPLSPITKSITRAPLTDEQRWHHLSSRTPANTPFVYAVLTTKIYCLPTCPSRLARRAKVVFFSTPQEAEREGFRACKRCKPDLSPFFIPAGPANLVPTSKSLSVTNLESSDNSTTQTDSASGDDKQDSNTTASASNSTPSIPAFDPTDPSLKLHLAVSLVKSKSRTGQKISLAQLAQEVGLSKWHLQRAFKRRCGRSPREMGEELLKESKRKDDEEITADSPTMRSDLEAGKTTLRSISNRNGFANDANIAGGTTADGIPFLTASPDIPIPDLDMSLFPTLNLWTLTNSTEWETDYHKLANSPLEPQRGDFQQQQDSAIVTPAGSSIPALCCSATDSLTESNSSYATTPAPPTDFSSPMLSDMDFRYDVDLYADGFSLDVDVEGVLRDLFPEVYDENMMDGHGKLM